MRRLLSMLSLRLPRRIVSDSVTHIPFLERYYIGTIFGLRVFLHRYIDDDPCGYHDHPFKWACNLLLAGSYVDHTRNGTSLARLFSLWDGDRFHRIELLRGRIQEKNGAWVDQIKPCWSLFIHRIDRVKPWGYLHNTIFREANDQPHCWWTNAVNYQGRSRDWWLASDLTDRRAPAAPRRINLSQS